MKNNSLVLPPSGTAIAAVAALLFSPLFAQASDFTDSAQVISSSPIIERVREERQDCSNVLPPQAAPQRERSFAGSIVGGLAGAILGSQVGQLVRWRAPLSATVSTTARRRSPRLRHRVVRR